VQLVMSDRIVGSEIMVPLLDGTTRPYINLDNAASTPPLREVMEVVGRFMPYYSSVHRGSGFKSRLSTQVYDLAHEIIARFVGADPQIHTVILGKNTTEAINKLAYRLPMPAGSVVLTTMMEHHSNDLPWRHRARTVHVSVSPEGRLDEGDFDRKLERHAGRVALVAVSGASNVTGLIQPIHRLARKAHQVGARILVDAAQLAPHRAIDMRAPGDPERLDFLALSGHKMYSPFGTGALIGPREVFSVGAPEYRGGGTVEVVTMDEVHWARSPDRDEAGSPNVTGAVALAAAIEVLSEVGMDSIAAHEAELTAHALRQMSRIPGLRIYGDSDVAGVADRLGVIPFALEGVSHSLVAAILGYEAGIGVRSGCFCAHPYVVHLLDLPSATRDDWKERVLAGDRSGMPGLVRVSFGCYNTREEVDLLVEALHRIRQGRILGDYVLDPATGEYDPRQATQDMSIYFSLVKRAPAVQDVCS